jgi:transposase
MMQPQIQDPQAEEPLAAFVAIDWADQKHHVALQEAGAGRPECFEICHKPEALADWIGSLRSRFGGQPVAVILEQKRGALIHALLGYEHLRLYPANPASLAKFREAFAPSGAKDDPPDALLLLEMLLKHRDRLRPWKPDDEQTRCLGLLAEDRRQAVNQRTRLVEKLTACLKGYFPQAIELLGGNLATRLAADLLLKWPSLERVQAAGPEAIRAFFYGHNSRRPDQLEQRLQALRDAVALTRDRAVIDAGVLKACLLARQIRALLPCIDQYERKIQQLLQNHPDRAIFEKLPGAGPALKPRLLSAFGTDRNRWKASAEIASFSGIAPVVERSGKHSWTHFRWTCPKFVRQSFHEFAACSIPFCPWAKSVYNIQFARGKGHHAAVRALAFKWIRILYRCWKDRVPFNPDLLPPVPNPQPRPC